MPSPERVAIFIDGSNFYHGLRAMFQRTSVDFGKFSEKLAADRKHVRTYYYIVPINQKENPQAYSQQQSFSPIWTKFRTWSDAWAGWSEGVKNSSVLTATELLNVISMLMKDCWRR